MSAVTGQQSSVKKYGGSLLVLRDPLTIDH
jgi:hypothetical protein